MRFFAAALAAMGVAQGVLAAMELVNPPPFSSRVDPSQYPVRATRDSLDIQWTPSETGKKFSIVLYRLNATQAADFKGVFTNKASGRMEMIARDLTEGTSFPWIVQTGESQTGGLAFSIALWQDGEDITDSASELFSITRDAMSSSSSSTTSSTASSTASSTSLASTISSTSTEPSATPTAGPDSSKSTQPADDPSPSSGGLSTGGIVGAAIGAVAGGVILFVAGWYLGRRQALNAMTQYHQQPPKYSYTGNPVELNAGPAAAEVHATYYRPYEMPSQ